MIPFYKQTLKFLILVCLINTGFTIKAKALVAGDIAFTGYISSNTSDEFTFVLMTNMPANTVINFTDNGWTGTALRATEGILTWTSNAAYNAGTEIRITVAQLTATTVSAASTYAGLGLSAGTVSHTSTTNTFNLSTSGDQIIAYQGTAASPTFISGIHMNYWTTAAGDPSNTTAAAWDGQGISGVSSAMPTGLTGGTTATWIYSASAQHPAEKTNARFNCTGLLNTVANVRTSVYTFSNWIGDANINPTSASFTLPTNCNYLGVFLPIQLTNFQARNMITDVAITWSAENAVAFSHFELERSNGDNNFNAIARIDASNTSTYAYTDMEALRTATPLFYYRLKMVDRDGQFTYSAVVRIKNRKGEAYVIDNLINPVKNKISFSYTAQTSGIVTLELMDIGGRRMAAKTYQAATGSTNMDIADDKVLPRGIYLLKVTANGTSNTYKLVKE